MFRGVLFNETLKIAGLKSTILITSILFTILHLSLISIFWIFPIGLVFGYLRAKYNTILYGVIGHFVYNASVVIVEIILN
jgi:membrane protease YdiL (CAAX protease family)